MGERGPARKSAAWHDQHGSGIGADRGMATPAGIPVKPDWIAAKSIASRYWDETVEELLETNVLTRLDRDALALYCDAWQQFHDAQAVIAKEGMTCVSEKTNAPYQHPAVGIANKARAEIRTLGKLFGLNPTAREGMVINGGMSENDLEVMRLIRGN